MWFQHTAARRRLAGCTFVASFDVSFNTQPPEGGWFCLLVHHFCVRSFNTQPPEGGWIIHFFKLFLTFCFNTQPPEGGWFCNACLYFPCNSFNTQPPEGGWTSTYSDCSYSSMFQHTAARRRLASSLFLFNFSHDVSTHSRPKAAGVYRAGRVWRLAGFNTQPPEGGWVAALLSLNLIPSFNTQPPEGGWIQHLNILSILLLFQHTAARRRLAASN